MDEVFSIKMKIEFIINGCIVTIDDIDNWLSRRLENIKMNKSEPSEDDSG